MKNLPSIPRLNLSQFDAAIFDLDGVVTQTAKVHAAAWKNMFDDFLNIRASQTGVPFQPFAPVQDYRQYVDGKPRYDGVTSFLHSRGIDLPYGEPSDHPSHDTICGLGNLKNRKFLETLHAQGVDVFPSTLALINFLKARGKTVAVVTASENCQEILQAAEIKDLFTVSVDGRDAKTFHLHGKPEPDTFVKAAELLGVHPQQAVVFEDALAGVEAGQAGHFGLVIGIDRAGQSEALHSHGGDVVVSDLVEIEVLDEAGVLWISSQALPSALHQFKKLMAEFHEKRVIVFLDYDGTLTPIVNRPELAVLSSEMREALTLLSRQCPVGIISGRDRKDVSDLVKLDSLIYAGSHGFDIAGPQELNLHHEVGTEFTSALDQAESDLRDRLLGIPGLLLERKKFSITVHYRLVPQDQIPKVAHVVTQVVSTFPTLQRSEGKKVFEIQPRLEWDKGKALLWLLDGLDWKEKNYFPVYIGDDLTDENAFRVLAGMGIGIVVEDGYRFSSAQYALENPHEVQQFLMHLYHHLDRMAS
ncbi:trehalose-phosphatase [Candidatus Nitronereus thalassa]|uniref:Trehalose 6-phosphate phosphatase n=1 Tax=Candidatus Nitronereus thalassa TaxID=3020898 RepID=A0ABU3K8Z3_9BACT|nr:trehalose-phosphatase [Candidatus Nitronereus thalassa]MDT7042882.1 trehalose-phosphatase [Candidatus Nitronereus thalassa]